MYLVVQPHGFVVHHIFMSSAPPGAVDIGHPLSPGPFALSPLLKGIDRAISGV